MQLTSKLPDVGTSIFTRIGVLAQQEKALNLAQGFPDFGVDPKLIELINHYTKAGYNQYAPATGALSLRNAISEKVSKLYGYKPNCNQEVTVTIGATEALFSSLQALIHPGDEVIYFEPAYDSYTPGIRLAGGTPIPVSLKAPDFQIDWQEVKSMINPKTRMIIINNPHNPIANCLAKDDLQQLQLILEGTDILLLSDEVYQHLVYDQQQHQSVLCYPDLYKRAVVCMSFGKTFHATGWRVGYAIAPANISKEIRRIHQFNTFSAYTPVQFALADYLKEDKHYNYLPSFFQKKRDRFISQLDNIPYKIKHCAGTYFICIDFSEHWKESDLALAEHLIKDHGIAAIPVGEFYEQPTHTGLLRFCFAKTDEVLDQAAALLKNIKL